MSSSLTRRECFYILGVSAGADEDEVKQAYFNRAKDCHPDKNQNDPEATKKFQSLSQAYLTLKRDFSHSGSHSYMDSDSDDSDNGDSINLLDFFYLVYQKMLEEEMRQRRIAALRTRSYAYRLYQPYSGLFSDYDPYTRDYNQSYRAAETPWQSGRTNYRAPTRPTETNQRDRETTRSRQSEQIGRPHVYTPKRQSTRHPSRANSAYDAAPSSSYHPTPDDKKRQSTVHPSRTKYANDAVPSFSTPDNKATKLQVRRAPAYVVSKPAQLSKKEQLAQQRRRQREANEIGKELRAKAERNARLKAELAQKTAI